MEFLLDTASLADIQTLTEYYPIVGVTTNPSILKAAGQIDFFDHLQNIRTVIGTDRMLHVQTVANRADQIEAEAERLIQMIDNRIYPKIKATEEGFKAINRLKDQGYRLTATVIYTKMQALTALACGADYLAVYVNRIENMGIDPYSMIEKITTLIRRENLPSKVLGASFKNLGQVEKAIEAGADAVTLPPTLLYGALNQPFVQQAVKDFEDDWKSLYEDRLITDL